MQLFEFTGLKPIQRLSNEPRSKSTATALKPSFKYTVRNNNKTKYTVFDLYHGSGFGRQVYVGLGATATKCTKFPRVIVIKAYCRDKGRRFKEEDILRKIHTDGCLPGVPQIPNDVWEQPFQLPRNDDLDPFREACMIFLTTTGQSLSMCKNVLQFLKAMYDLTEGLCPNSLIHTDTDQY
jgi:hypothetical protein